MNSLTPQVPCKKLFEPLTINGMTLKNRIVMTAMHLNYTPQGIATRQLMEFYKARAIGGAGLLCIGGCGIDVVGSGTYMIGLYDDRFIESLAKFVSDIKAEVPDVKISAQLYHAGRYSKSWLTGMQPVSSSVLNSRYNPEMPRALELDEIPKYQQLFADAAVRAKAAGIDTVEIIASAGYLIPQFLSPATNNRTDQYGGSFENRVRFGVETIQKTREAVGDDYPLFVRLAGSDHVPGGHTNLDSARVAVEFEKAGIDAINVTGGWHEANVPQLTMSVPRGVYVYLAHTIKKAVNVPVVACNRINNPLLAEQILQEGKADMVGVARGLIADPEFPNKAKKGQYHLIRKCIACNQGCFDHVFMGMDVNCMVNYRAGREYELPPLPMADTPKTVVVVGGGPAGCEAARIAAKRGHKVILFEKDNRLGGALHLCAAPPGREEFLEIVRYHKCALAELSVDIRLGQRVTVDQIKALTPDEVVFAGGADPIVPPFVKDAKMENVYNAEDVLLGKTPCFGDTAVIGGGAVGCETALFLAHQGRISPQMASFLIETGAESSERVAQLLIEPVRKVHIFEMLGKLGEDIGKSTRWTMMLDLNRSEVQMHASTKVLSIEQNGVLVESAEGDPVLIECNNVVVALGYKSNATLADELDAAGFSVNVIGDSKAPRRAIDAIEEGYKTGMDI